MTWKRPLYWKTPLASLRGSARSLPLASSVTLLMMWSVAQRDLLASAASRSCGALTRWRVCFDCKLALLAAVGEAAGGGAGRIDAGQDARQAGRDGSEEHGGRVDGRSGQELAIESTAVTMQKKHRNTKLYTGMRECASKKSVFFLEK